MLAFEGEFEGIGDQVQDDLLPHAAVHKDRLLKLGAVQLKPQAGFFRGRTKNAGEFDGERGKVGRLVDGLHPARFNSREIQQSVDQPEQARPVAVYQFELAFGGGRKPGVALRQQIFDRTQHESQRSSEFMADIAEESSLGAINFRRTLPAVCALPRRRAHSGSQ